MDLIRMIVQFSTWLATWPSDFLR